MKLHELQEDRLRPAAGEGPALTATLEVDNRSLMSTKERTKMIRSHNKRPLELPTSLLARPTGARWAPHRSRVRSLVKTTATRRSTPSSSRTTVAAIYCSLPFVLLIILCGFTVNRHSQQPASGPTTMLAQAQFLFTYEINQESDESRVPRSSLFDPSSFKIVTPSQLQSSYQKLASQLPEPVSEHRTPAPVAPVVSATPETTLTSSPESSPHHHQHQQSQPQFQSLLEQPPTPASVLPPATGPSSSASFLKQTSAAIQSFAELFHLTPSSSPAPLAALQTPASVSSSQQQQPSIVATNSIDQQAEARSLHEHWTQQQKRAHNQAATGQTGPTQVSAFQSFTTPSTTIPSGSSVGGAGISPTQTVPTSHQQSGSQASYWLTSNPLNAPDGNFLVEIKNTGEQTTGNQESGEQSLGQQQQPHQNLPSHHHHQQQQQQQQQPPATTASSFIRPTSAHSSFLSTPTSTSYFGLPSGANQRQAPTEAAAIAPIHHHHHQQQQHHQTNQIAQAVATPTTPATTHVDRFSQQNFRKQATHFQPQTQALHQHQARSLSNHQQQQQHQQARQLTTPTSHQQHHHHQQTQSDLLEGQLQPPANTPEHYGGGDTGSMPSTAAGYSSSGSVAPIRQMVAPLKSAEESLIAFRQQQQSQHDQQGALLAAVQNQYAAQTAGQRQSNGAGELPPSTGNSLLEDELLPPGLANQPQHHHHQHHSLESVGTGSEQQRPKLPVSGLTSNTYSAMPQSSHQQQQQQQQQAAARQQQQQQQQQAPAEIPKVSPQIYESFLLQQKDQYEKHMELLKQQLELNKLLEQKQKQQQQQQQQEAEKRKRKKEELERVEARKKASAAREQELQLVAARKARQEAEEARRKQMRQLEEEEAKRKRASEEERRYRELMEAREREEAQRKRQEAEEAAELARRQQREQRERDALAEQQKRRREQQEAADEEAKQQQQYRNYMKQQEELKKLLELKQREDEAAQARQRQAGQILKQQQAQQNNRQATTTVVAGQTRANKLALEHKERARQISNGPQSASSGWGGRQPTRVRAVAVSSANHQQPEVQHPQKQTQNFVPNTSSMAPTTTTTSTTTTTTTPASPPSSSASPSATPRVGTRLSSSGGGLRRLKADEKLIRQKIPLYSGAGKYGLYQSGSNSDELAKLLEAVNLPPPQASTSASAQSTTSTSTTTTTTQATTSSSNNSSTQTPSSSSSGNYLLNEDDQPNRSLTSSSLSPLLNLRELGVTPPSASQAQARPTTGEPFSSTTIFDDDVPRRPVRQPASGASSSASGPSLSTGPTVSAQPSLTRRSFPAPISQAASSTSSTRTVLTNRMGTAGSSNSSSSSGQRGASIGLASLPADSDNDGIPGRAGHEYPILAEVPQTSFSCSRMKLSGFFADTETACQVVHLCQDGVQSSILCPNGTIFNQEKFSCQWWYEVNCARAPMFYQLNDNLYKSSLTGSSSSSNDQDNNSSTAPSVELNKRTRTGHHHHNHGSAPTSNHLKAS